MRNYHSYDVFFSINPSLIVINIVICFLGADYMKPFMCIDLTEDKNNENPNGEEFLVCEPSDSVSSAVDASEEKVLDTLEKGNLSLPFHILSWICGAVLIVSVFVAEFLCESDDLFKIISNIYHNHFWIILIFLTALICFIVLRIIAHIKDKKIKNSEEYNLALQYAEGVNNAVFSELSVPLNAKEIDILYFTYKIKKGEIKFERIGFDDPILLNTPYKFFTDEGKLYFADLEGKYSIELTSLKAIKTIKERIVINLWNKDVPHNKGEYKQYKMRQTDSEGYLLKYYHILEFEHNGEQWGIYFPCYELPLIEELTGLKAEPLK